MMKHIRLLALLILLPLAAWAGDTLLIPAAGGGGKGYTSFFFVSSNPSGSVDVGFRLFPNVAISLATEGYVMPWSGSIVGGSCVMETIATFNSAGFAFLSVLINNTPVAGFTSLNITGLGFNEISGVLAEGVTTFAAGDLLNGAGDIVGSGIDTNGTLDSNTDDWFCTVLVAFD